MILSLKRGAQGSQFVQNATESPDVALFVVFLIVDLFRAHVVGGAHVGLRELGLFCDDPR